MRVREREAVIKEAMSWRGTPFRDSARVKGARGGVDCGQFLVAVYGEALGIEIAPGPSYNLQFMLNSIEELYIQELLGYSVEIEEKDAIPADVVVLRWGHVYSHGAILLDPWCGRIIHALNGFGVMVTDAKRDGRMQASLRKFRQSPPRFFRPKGWA